MPGVGAMMDDGEFLRKKLQVMAEYPSRERTFKMRILVGISRESSTLRVQK